MGSGDELVINVIELWHNKLSTYAIGMRLGVSQEQVRGILRRFRLIKKYHMSSLYVSEKKPAYRYSKSA
jgi:hypothetical protein